MKIKSLHIKNFKSIVDLTINEPNPFTVFVGPNGSGKSNIFEALEFFLKYGESEETPRFFGGNNNLMNVNLRSEPRIFDFYVDNDGTESIHSNSVNKVQIFKIGSVEIHDRNSEDLAFYEKHSESLPENSAFKKRIKNIIAFKKQLSRYFFQTKIENRINYSDDSKLNFNGNNLEKVLKRILQNPVLREEILDYLTMLVPELENIEIITDEIDGDSKLRIYEKFSKKPFNKALISDGTYNILCLLAAVYQSEEPQFLCIEEPENGLSPYAIEMLVGLFRTHCQDYGHYIWLNTHSQTLVRNLKPEEFILVDKIQGETKIKQYKAGDLEGWSMDEAWLTNALGGGLPW